MNVMVLEREDTELNMYGDDSTEYATGRIVAILEE